MDILVVDGAAVAFGTASGVEVPDADAEGDVLVVVLGGSVPNFNVLALACGETQSASATSQS